MLSPVNRQLTLLVGVKPGSGSGFGGIGEQGPQGPVGPQGPQGAIGPQGPAGPQGPQGPAGTNGTNGTNGINGVNGAPGPQGPAGPAGDTTRLSSSVVTLGVGSKTFTYTVPSSNIGWAIGTRLRAFIEDGRYMEGVVTAVSSTAVTFTSDYFIGAGNGSAWFIGIAGDRGTNGTNGTNGVDGETGPQGPAGPAGPTGPAGATGLKGDQGDPGPEGPQGIPGADGAPGDNGLSAYQIALSLGFIGTMEEWLDSLIGSQGEQGIQGIQGIQGNTGPQGIQGEQGPQGIQGETGPTGATGPAGADGVDGATWSSGSGVPSGGVDGDFYLRESNYDVYKKIAGTWTVVVNIKGIQGDTGTAGTNGTNGLDGATWTSGTGSPTGGNDGDFYLQTTNGDIWKKTAGTWAVVLAAPAIAYLVGFVPGTTVANQVMAVVVFAKAQRLPAGATDSQAKSLVTATGSTTITMSKNGTPVGTIVFTSAGNTGTFTVSADVDFAIGDTLSFTGPTTPDATFAGLSFNIKLVGI